MLYTCMYMYTCQEYISVNATFFFNKDASNIIGIPKKGSMSGYQAQVLMKHFQAKPYMKRGEKRQLARLFNTSERRIANWFGNMRRQKRKERLKSKGEYSTVMYNQCMLYFQNET